MRSDTFAAQRALGYHRKHLCRLRPADRRTWRDSQCGRGARPRCRASAPKDWSFTYALPISCLNMCVARE
jgi:hypothetical protein